MVTTKSIAELWARLEDQFSETRSRWVTKPQPQELSERDSNTLASAIDILNAHDAFLDVLSAEKNNRDTLEPRDFRVEFTTFFLQRKAINKHRRY